MLVKNNISKYLLLSQVFIFGICNPASSQFKKSSIQINDSSEVVINYNCSEIKHVDCAGKIDPVNNNSNWMPQLISFKIEHDVPDPELLKKIKAEKLKEKEAAIPINVRKVYSTNDVVDPPNIGVNLFTNASRQGTPPDNTIAISNSGKIVSAINSNIIYLDSEGNKIFEKTFKNFFNDPELSFKLFDPVLYYDSGADRFIFVLLHTDNDGITNSKLVICFSESNDPIDGWHVYIIPADSIYSQKWFDYPRIGISNNELFVSVNVFKNSMGFETAALFQINKYKGYLGQQLDYLLWDSITTNPFTLVPVSYGHQGTYGPGIYLLTTRYLGGSDIILFDITNDLDKSPSMNSYTISTMSYETGANAYQLGDEDELDVGDCRIQHAFFLNDIIHFVFNAEYSSGYTGFIYSRLNVTNRSNSPISYGQVGRTYCYPSVASFTENGSNLKDVVIGFLASDTNNYPHFQAVAVDNLGEFSAPIIIKEGETYVDLMDGERWGDYSGISRLHNSDSNPTVWVSGCYGANIQGSYYRAYKTWVAELKAKKTNSIESMQINNISQPIIYPNPIADLFYIDLNLVETKNIDISIFDLNGSLVKTLYNGVAREGRSVLSFNRNALSSGVYFVVFKDGNNIIKSEKVIVSE